MSNAFDEEIDLFAEDDASSKSKRSYSQTTINKLDSSVEGQLNPIKPSTNKEYDRAVGSVNFTYTDIDVQITPFEMDLENKRKLVGEERDEVGQSNTPKDKEHDKQVDTKFQLLIKKPTFQLKQAYRSEIMTIILGSIAVFFTVFPELTTWLLVTFRSENSKLSEKVFNGELELYYQIAALVIVLLCSYRLAKIRLTWRCLFGPLRLTSKKGFISKNTNSVTYNRIQTVECNQSPLGLLLNFGTIEVGSSGTSEAEVVLYNVYRPTDVANEIYSRMRNFDQNNQENINSFKK